MSVDTLQLKIRKKKNPSVAALDFRPEQLPPCLLENPAEQSPEVLAEAYERFGTTLLDGLAGTVPAVKFNTAFYEALGGAGLDVLRRLCAHARKLGYYVMVETMRSDLEPAAEVSANTYFGPLFDADAVCIGAFTGSDGVRPYLPYCKERDKSVFLLARTPNKSAREVQDLISGDRVIHTVMTDLAMRWSTDLFAKSGYSQVGVVLGVTHGQTLRQLRDRYDRLFFLVPGCPAKEAQYAFDKFGHGAVVEISGLPEAWRKAGDDADYVQAAVKAAEKARDELGKYVTVI